MTQMTRSELGGATRFVNIGSAAALDNLGAMTVISCCKLTAAPTVTGYLFSKSPSASGWDRLLVAATGAFTFGRDSSGTINAPSKTSAISVVNITGTWQWLQATTDGTLLPAGINLYHDAGTSLAAAAETTGTGALTDNSAQDVFLLNRNGLDREFQGAVGYTAVWNRVLSDAERTTVRTVGPLAVPTGLRFCWANEQDFGPGAYTATRSTFVDGGVPTFADLGDTAATATTLSGPSSGTVGVASTNFTVAANGSITGTVIITPSDAANGGTFTPTTVSISSASPTGTFTYTPASTGAKTISTTNNGALTNPTSLTYTSNSSAATATTLSGPSSGTVSVASTNFTVGANGAITGTVIITPADAANGGTFTPTTVSINTASPTGTFTYTPATTGVKTISTTNNGALTNPTAISYTSNAAGGSAVGAAALIYQMIGDSNV